MRSPASLALLLLAVFAPARADDGPEPAAERRAHDVSGLLDPLEVRRAPRLGLVNDYNPHLDPEEPGVLTFEGEAGPGAWLEAHELLRWASGPEGRMAELRRGRLVTELTPGEHERLAACLRAMQQESRRALSLAIEVIALAPEHERALRGGAGAALDAEALAALAAASRAGGRLGSLRLQVRDGERAVQANLERTTFLGDREVNQTGILPVLNPVTEELRTGALVEVAAARAPGESDRWLLDVRLERAERDPLMREAILRQAGRIQLPSASHLALGVSLQVEPGQTTLLGALRVPAGEGRREPRTLALVCRADPAAPAVNAKAGAAPEGVFLRRHSLRAVLPPPSTRFPGGGVSADATGGGGGFVFEGEEGSPPEVEWTPEELADRAMGEAAQGSWEDPQSGCWIEARGQALLVAQTAAGHAAVEAFLRKEAALSWVQHELLLLQAPESVEDAAPPPPHVLDATAWEALARAHPVEERLLLCGQDGQEVSGLLRREVRVVTEVELSAGGDGGPSTTAVPEDPIVQTALAGTRLRVRGQAGAEGVVTLELQIDRRDLGALERVEAPEGTFDRLVGAKHLAIERRATLGPGQGLLWELGAGAERKLLLLRSRAVPAR